MFKNGQKFENEINLRIYSAAELKVLLKEAGFSVVKAYGGFDGSAYDQQAKRLVTVANKGQSVLDN